MRLRHWGTSSDFRGKSSQRPLSTNDLGADSPSLRGHSSGRGNADHSGSRQITAAALPARRTELCENLGRAFPDWSNEQLDNIAREAFSAHFSNQYASFSFGKCDAENWPQYLTLEGLEHLDHAYQQGKGVVLMHPHMGPAQLPLHVLALQGFDMHQVGGGEVTLVELSETGQWAAQQRTELEARMPVTLHDGKKYLRPLLRALKGWRRADVCW